MPKKYLVHRDQQHTYFDRAIPPARRVRAGDIVTFETDDTTYEMLWREMSMEGEHLNAVTGQVYVYGALLSLGDVHASIGANEGTWAGLGSRARVTVRVGGVSKMGLTSPRIRLGKTTICVAIEDTVEEACMVAMRRAYYLLTAEMGFTPYEAYAYCAARVHLRLGGPNGLREESYGIVLAYVPDIE
jgi:acetamidase/formamidase